MFKSVFPRRDTPSVEPIQPTSGATRDLLVMGYLSAVAHAMERAGVAASRIRMGAPDCDLLRGSLDLELAVVPGRLSWGCPLSASWDEDDGWSAELRTPMSGESARRFLHAEVISPPQVVSDFIAGLAEGRDVGLLYPATCSSGHERLLGDLARYAVPEVRRWLRTPH